MNILILFIKIGGEVGTSKQIPFINALVSIILKKIDPKYRTKKELTNRITISWPNYSNTIGQFSFCPRSRIDFQHSVNRRKTLKIPAYW